MSFSHLGKKPSEETKKKLHIAQLGNKKWLGKKHTKETKKKQSIAAFARWQNQKFLPLEQL